MRFLDDATALRSQQDARRRFFTVEKLGDKQSLTPEGFLVVHDVPIARIGVQEYHEDEVNPPGQPPEVRGDENGVVRVHREEDEVFKPDHVLSYQGKAIVNDHPEGEDVNPGNYKALTVGTVLNPHRGTGVEKDLLFADFIICDAQAIEDVRAGKREVSCGYDADYVEVKPGVGKQINLIGNHVALVDAGRCGPMCSIRDRKPVRCAQGANSSEGDADMRIRTQDKQPAWLSRFLDARKRRDAARKAKDAEEERAAEREMEDAAKDAESLPGDLGGEPQEHTHVHVHTDADPTLENGGAGINGGEPARMTDEEIRNGFGEIGKSMDAMRKSLDAIARHVGFEGGSEDAEAEEALEREAEEEVPVESRDRARRVRDSSFMQDSVQSVAATAEILVPGIRIPTFDRAAPKTKTFKDLCALRRTALELLNNSAEGRAIVESANGQPLALDGMRCGAVRTLFNAVGAIKRQANRDRSQGRTSVADLGSGFTGERKRVTPADIQKANEAYREKLRGRSAAH